MPVMRRLYENGVWAIFSTLDPRVLQFKPGMLMTRPMCRGAAGPLRDRRGLARERGDGRQTEDGLMEPQIRTLVDIADTPAARSRGDMMLERAHWAARCSSATTAPRHGDRRCRRGRRPCQGRPLRRLGGARRPASAWSSTRSSRTSSRRAAGGFLPRSRISSIRASTSSARSSSCRARPGVVFALTPSTNPIATLYYKVLLALMTRNAIVFSPHPAARECSVDAARGRWRPRSRPGRPTA